MKPGLKKVSKQRLGFVAERGVAEMNGTPLKLQKYIFKFPKK